MALKDDLDIIIGTSVESTTVLFLLENIGPHTQADISKKIGHAQSEVSIALNGLISKGFIHRSTKNYKFHYEIPSKKWLKEQLHFFQQTKNEELMKLIAGI
jgi:predicted transcriptional regulator